MSEDRLHTVYFAHWQDSHKMS